MGLGRFFRRRYWDEERKRELDAYLEQETSDNVARGMSPEEARYAARRKLGNVTSIREEIHLMNTAGFLDACAQDLRNGLRRLATERAFSAVAVATLGLGIGSVTVMYSVVDNVLLDPFPYARSQRMVDVLVRDAEKPLGVFRGPLIPAEFLDLQEQTHAFEDVAGTLVDEMVLSTKERAAPFDVAWGTPNLFEFLGVSPALGRVFGPSDARPGAPPVAVLSHAAWLREFGSDPGILGRTIVLNGEPRTVIGVMPPRFTWHVADAWLPSTIERTSPDRPQARRWFQAHLKPGVGVEEAKAELNVIAARRAREHSQDYPKHFRMEVVTVIDWVVGRFRGVLYSLFGAVALLLLIACVNVANMLLARATAREREMAIRSALGASRGRIVRQLLTESLLLALAGGAAGCLLAWGGLAVLLRFLPRQGIAYEVEISLDRPVLVFALLVSALTSLLFGLLPALHGSRRDLVAGLKQGGRGIAGGFRHGGLRKGLVMGEVGLSLVLLLCAGLLMRSFLRMVQVDLGFDPAGVVSTSVIFPPGNRPSGAARDAYYREAVQAVRALPGVVAATAATGLPLGGYRSDIEAPGRPQAERRTVRVQLCGEGYLMTFGMRLLRGRDLDEADVAGARKVALVNDALVRAHFGDTEALGRTIVLQRLTTLPAPVLDPTFEIVGVVADARNAGLGERPEPAAYLPSSTAGLVERDVYLRTTGEASRLVEPMRQAIATVDPGVALFQPLALEPRIRENFYAQPRFSLMVLGTFAAIGLLLVGVGVYGVMAYTVARQSQEIAVRMALGAGRGQVYALVLSAGARLLAGGLVVGVLLSLGASRLIAAQLWNTSPYDPAAAGVAMAVVSALGLLACYLPAARAVRIDPVAALRLE